jgi:hypothetical protein
MDHSVYQFSVYMTLIASRWPLLGTACGSAVFGEGEQAPLLAGVEYEKEQGELASMLFFGPFGIPAKFELDSRTRSALSEGAGMRMSSWL